MLSFSLPWTMPLILSLYSAVSHPVERSPSGSGTASSGSADAHIGTTASTVSTGRGQVSPEHKPAGKSTNPSAHPASPSSATSSEPGSTLEAKAKPTQGSEEQSKSLPPSTQGGKTGHPKGHEPGHHGHHRSHDKGHEPGHHARPFSGLHGCEHCQQHRAKHGSPGAGPRGCKPCPSHHGKQRGKHLRPPGCKSCLKHRGPNSFRGSGQHPCKDCRFRAGAHHRDGGPHTSYRRPSWGGFGYTTAGILFGDWGSYRKALTHPSGTTLDHAKATYLVGGGGAMLIRGRYLIGGKGYGIFSPLVEADWGKAALTGGGGGFDLGLVLINHRRWLVYPKAGFGGQGHTLTIRNSSNTNMRFGAGASPIVAESDEQFTTGFFTADIGIGFQRLIFPRTDGGGLVNGGEVGVMMSLSEGAWSDDNEGTVRGVAPLRMIALYLRLNLGGGGFTWTKFGEK